VGGLIYADIIGRHTAPPEVGNSSNTPTTDASAVAAISAARPDPVRLAFLRPPPHPGRRPAHYSMLLRDATRTPSLSLAERLVGEDGWFTATLAERAADCRERLKSARVGGDCWHKPAPESVQRPAVVFAAESAAQTWAMAEEAIAVAGADNVVVVGPARHLPGTVRSRGLTTLAAPADPWPLIEAASLVFVAGDTDEGMIARLLDKKLRCHAPGALAATKDTLKLIAAALLLGTRYVSPYSGESVTCEAFIDLAREWRRGYAVRHEIACCLGIRPWKRKRIGEFLDTGAVPAFTSSSRAAIAIAKAKGGAVAVWSSCMPYNLEQHAAQAGIAVRRIEDGFIRSVGLGADCMPPMSVVLDRTGIYYDPARPSDLETLLAETSFTPDILSRARDLRRRIVEGGVTKYNLGVSHAVLPSKTRRVVLVAGQVENDRSVLFGGGGVRAGVDLLRRVRHHEPDAHIVYKPHPDVEAGHRRGVIPDELVLRFADRIVRDVDIDTLLAWVDEVHTLTSLIGFEALLRGKKVTIHGQPFYSGWGLTTDTNPPARRTRRLSLDELVAGALILYPAYIDPVSLLPCGPEVILDRLAELAECSASPMVRARRLQGRLTYRLRAWRARRALHGSHAT
jgi:capsular polysaccharide export protein